MKRIVAVLVLVNVFFALWLQPFSGERVEAPVPNRLGEPSSIVLVREAEDEDNLPTAGAPDAAASAVAQVLIAATESAPACLSVGPFQSESQYGLAAATLLDAGIDTTRRAEDGEIWLGRWIYLPNVTSQAQADELSGQLAAAGFFETYFDPNGADGDLLSLGLFREIARAEALLDRVVEAGFESVMVDRTESGTIYWADFEITDSFDPDLTEMQLPGSIVRMETRLCENSELTPG